MNPVLIYQNETTLDYNNEFTIDFVDNNNVNYINFLRKNQYYIASLNCNITKANKKKVTFEGSKSLVDELSKTSSDLLTKGPASKNDIDYMVSSLTQNFNLPDLAPQKYKLVLDPVVINTNSFNYKFYDVKDKRIKFAKIYSPFSHLKNGFVFKGEKDPNKDKKVLIQLVNNSKMRCIFSRSKNDQWEIEKNFYRDLNTKFVKTRRRNGTYEWDSTHPILFLLAEEKALRVENFHTATFMKELYWDQHYVTKEKGKFPVIGTPLTSVIAGSYQPFIQRNLSVTIQKNKPFLIYGSSDKKRHKFSFDSILDDCEYLGDYPLTDDDKKEIKKNFPNFSFNSLGEYVALTDKTNKTQWKENDLLFPSATKTATNSTTVFDPKTQFMKFVCENTKYKNYLDSNDGIFFFDSYKDLPGDLDNCEKLFDKDVLEIKKLVNDIGQLKEITEYEQLNLALYDDSNIIEETFVQRFNKQIQLYGFVSIPFSHTKKNHLITLKNLLPFRVLNDVVKENISFELSYLEKEDDIVTDDKKIHNLSIVCVEKKRQMPLIEKEVTIEALQAFDKYQKLNPIDIKITDNEVFKELTIVGNRGLKYRFIPNTFLFSSSVQQETEVISLTVTGLNEARDIYINGKSYKAIGCIFTNEIEGWDQIKKLTSNWVSCKLSNSKYPFGAKRLGFEFDTTRLKALVDFTLYLIDQKGNEITFSATEQKTPSLNFTIQIIS